MRHLRQLLLIEAITLIRQGDGDNRDIFNSFRFDNGLTHANTLRHPIFIGIKFVVDAHHRIITWHTHFENGNDHRAIRLRE
ncbi:Uncharacterised protein [Vibrio cholerae]|uniref:Uncharacterized protein n=1 Tax=Vibrio cholerae TaxID=666 RepID=A0A655VJU8_VIBCL|nr:Uncharacterised protein [Vibrio cholerae]